MAPQGDLGVVVMPALAPNLVLNLGRVFRPPFSAEDEIGLDFEELLEDQREALAGRFLQGEYSDLVVVQLEMSTVTLQGAIGHVVIQEGIVLWFRKVHFVRSKIEKLLEKDKDLILGQEGELTEVFEL
jgi:hypothetical protein